MNMWINGRLLSLLSFVWLANAKNQNVLPYTKQNHHPKCNDTVIEELDKCWTTLPELTFHGIPSDPEKIENACSVFSSGMECVDNWSKTCLSREAHEKLVNSVVGALQLYKFLCSDLKFRGEYLKHRSCYVRISSYWEACNVHFLELVERIDHSKNTLALCCIRWQYIECVETFAKILCSTNATILLSKITDDLLLTTMRSYHHSSCVAIDKYSCSTKSGGSIVKFVMNYFSLYNGTFTETVASIIYFFMVRYVTLAFK